MNNRTRNAFVAAGTSSLLTMQGRADVVYARSLLAARNLKGTVGEFFAEKFSLPSHTSLKLSFLSSCLSLR